MSAALEKLGKDVAAALKHGPGERRARQLPALLAVDWGRRRRSAWALRAIPALAVMAAIAVVAFWLNARGSRSVPAATTLELVADGALDEGRWLQVDERALRMTFADKSEVLLEPRSVARFSPRSGTDARLTLEAGGLRARIQPATVTGRSWSFNAGPFRVLVVGTELSVSWSAQESLLSVHVLHGRVQVRGGALEPSGLLLASEDRLEVRHGRILIQRGPGSVAELAASAPVISAPPALERPPPESTPAPARSAKPATGSAPSAPNWQELARAGDYRQALLTAEAEGFDSLIERLGAADLALLADAARLGGSASRARQALLTLRRRFPTVAAAQVGAFRLGRLAVAQHNYAEAATWFETYLKSAPSGALAAEAAGRLIETRARSGNRAGAEAAARDYLARFPGGAYESVARALLRGDKLVPK